MASSNLCTFAMTLDWIGFRSAIYIWVVNDSLTTFTLVSVNFELLIVLSKNLNQLSKGINLFPTHWPGERLSCYSQLRVGGA